MRNSYNEHIRFFSIHGSDQDNFNKNSKTKLLYSSFYMYIRKKNNAKGDFVNLFSNLNVKIFVFNSYHFD